MTLLMAVAVVGTCQSANAQVDKEAAQAAQKDAKRRGEAEEALSTLSSLLKTKAEQESEIKRLKSELRLAREEASKKELEGQIKRENEKLDQLAKRISALMTGTASDALEDGAGVPFNIQTELEGLVQPFIKMLKEATENTRQIENLKDQIALAQKRQQASSRAIERLGLLLEVDTKNNANGKSPTNRQLKASLKEWQTRAEEAVTLEETAKQQLAIRLEEGEAETGGMATYATKFFQERGLNLLLALGAAALVFLFAEVVSRGVTWLRHRQGFRRNFWTRLTSLIFRVVSFVVAFISMLIIFNVMNDWLLLGVASLFALAAAWLGIKMLPSIVEQVTLLLNLGAVQEDERIVIDGVPWKVVRLDLYTDLKNPVLDGGEFTVPVRQLIGLHSRPSGVSEPWFPTKIGDWIVYDDNQYGQVISQTPELVQIREPGGSLITFDTSAFVEKAPRNLSKGFRIRSEFGLDYCHQHEATNAIPSLLREFVQKGLVAVFGEQSISKVDVDLLNAADSALIFEVEAVFPGFMAPRYEDAEREIIRLMVDASNKHGWTIPFPQMVVHRSAG